MGHISMSFFSLIQQLRRPFEPMSQETCGAGMLYLQLIPYGTAISSLGVVSYIYTTSCAPAEPQSPVLSRK